MTIDGIPVILGTAELFTPAVKVRYGVRMYTGSGYLVLGVTDDKRKAEQLVKHLNQSVGAVAYESLSVRWPACFDEKNWDAAARAARDKKRKVKA